ncbi:biogenesis of lysosome-related organelles complex 1 subunit 6-like [Ciona intestinalis]
MDYNDSLHGTANVLPTTQQGDGPPQVVDNQGDGNKGPEDTNLSVKQIPLVFEVSPVSSESEVLSHHFFKEFEPMLKETKAKLTDIEQNQKVLIESLEREGEKLKENGDFVEIETAMSTVHSYRVKLNRLKRNMSYLKEATMRLRKEAFHLEQLKRKEIKKEEERSKKMLEAEINLTAKLSKQSK